MRNRLSSLTLAICAIMFATWLVGSGCHRSFYRREADGEARMLIREKLNDARWSQIEPTIETAPDSRMYDPFSADHPPMPNDDRASHEFMHCVDGKPGYQYWHVNGDTSAVENPDWRAYLPVDERGVLVLDLETAVQLSLIHSPALQRQRENLYQSALTVSLERFGFDLQAFSDWRGFFDTAGRLRGGDTSTSLSGRTALEKLSINGTTFVVGLANTLVWNFSGTDNRFGTNSLIDFTLIQPLLRGYGRQIVMESLTQAERNLLADVRQLERFRRGFYLFVVTGRNAGAGPGTNFLNEPGRGGFGAGGIIGLLERRQEIRIREFNVQSLENVLDQFREFFKEQRINLLQVRQAETSLYNAQDTLLRLRVSYQNELDQFKRDLGLPPDLEVEIKDPFLDQFELVDDELLQRQLEIGLVRDEIGLILFKVNPNSEDGTFDDSELQWSPELEQALRELLPVFDDLQPFFAQLAGADRELVLGDLDKLDSVTDQRKEELLTLRDFVAGSEGIFDIEPSILQPESIVSTGLLRTELDELQEKLKLIQVSVSDVSNEILQLIEEGPGLSSDELKKRLEENVIFDTPEAVTRLADAVIELTLIQARARTNSISLPAIELDSEAAWSIACQFRRDLMNARAALVDEWRQIELAADALESELDVIFNGSVGTTDDNLFGFDWSANQFGMGFRFDAPITRYVERNQYRNTLINYQRARRSYYQFEDSIKQNLRETLRAIDQSKVVFELNRRSIGAAVEQVELARFDLIRPVRPGQGGGQTTLGPTAARDLTSALNALQSAQNQFLSVWVSYEVARRGLDFDLGTMQLTPDGYWLDPGTINEAYAYRAAEAFGIPAESICLPPDVSFSDPGDGMGPEMAPAEMPESGAEEYYEDGEFPNSDAQPSLDPAVRPDEQAAQSKRRGLFENVLKNTGFNKNQ